ncbi:N-acyltransferase YncA [Thalassovita gelatinovora]|uniref:N-acyltransferase YncA n=1 Tax=Thalassovita gelatinovora TaxID=53501 RepID=A0A0P1F582_THAGE|nr:GNAT family N-acetyltransferase [Thalassovita gelatinovora]QIZ79523.1 N-acetyltransferase [Thalassovita gelatinovora]CUH62967.1 N-acyltransferase YncA [Thalassovita gelatinovora]SEQ13232.1 phosphinothricin acetyltransferase [Thalassovita gelatinovora]
MQIRNATAGDAAAIAAIYNDAVLHTTAIWNDVTVDAANRADWIVQRQAQGFPVLVACDAAAVFGYASYGPFRAFDGYRMTVEHSVYVDATRRGSGTGRHLMQALIKQAQTDGLHVMVAAIEAGNAASIRLHQQLGFQQTGLMPQVGQKFGRWLDLAMLQLRLNDRATP